MKNKVLILKGLPGSGKSTLAMELKKQNPNYVVVERDLIREKLYGATKEMFKGDENLVTYIQYKQVLEFLSEGRDIIISDTNLNENYLDRFIGHIKKNFPDTEIVINESLLEVPLQVCIDRDKGRGYKEVGEKVIRGMYNKYLKSKQVNMTRLNFREQDESLPKCVMVDVDGTLTTGPFDRSPYDETKVDQDLPNTYLMSLLKVLLTDGTKLFVFSGRKDSCRKETEEWLDKHLGLPYELHMRQHSDNRKDALVKEELFKKHVEGKYFVSAVFDDRLQVCELWHSLGLPLFRVGDPNANF